MFLMGSAHVVFILRTVMAEEIPRKGVMTISSWLLAPSRKLARQRHSSYGLLWLTAHFRVSVDPTLHSMESFYVCYFIECLRPHGIMRLTERESLQPQRFHWHYRCHYC